MIPTLHPAPRHRAQEVGVEALRLLHSVEDPADVHHLWERRDKAGVTALLPGLLGWTGPRGTSSNSKEVGLDEILGRNPSL